MLKRILGLLKRILGLGLNTVEGVVDSAETTDYLTTKGIAKLDSEQSEREQDIIRLRIQSKNSKKALASNEANVILYTAEAKRCIEEKKEEEAHSYLDRKEVVEDLVVKLKENIVKIDEKIEAIVKAHKRANLTKEEFKVLKISLDLENDLIAMDETLLKSNGLKNHESAKAIFEKAKRKGESRRDLYEATKKTKEELGTVEVEEVVITRTLSASDRLKGITEHDVVNEEK